MKFFFFADPDLVPDPDPTPDPAPFSIDLRMGKNIFSHIFSLTCLQANHLQSKYLIFARIVC